MRLLKILVLFISLTVSFTLFAKKEKKISKELEYKYSLIEGMKHKYIGSLNSSIALLKNTIAISDSSSTAYFELANIYLMQNKIKEALFYSELAAKNSPNNIWFQLQLGQIYISLKQYDKAIIIFRRLIELKPDELDFHYQLANIYLKNGDPNNALKVYEEVEKRYSKLEANSLYKYSLYIELNQLDKAEKEIKTLLNLYPSKYTYNNYIANLYLLKGDSVNAVNHFYKVLSRESDNPIALKGLINIYLNDRRFKQVIGLIHDFFVNNRIMENEKISFYFNLTPVMDSLAFASDSLKSSLFEFTSMSNSLQSKSLYADFLVRGKYYDDALIQLKELVELNSRNILFWSQILNVFSIKSYSDSVVKYADNAILQFKKEPIFYLYAGLSYLQLDSISLALKRFKSGLKCVDKETENFRFDFNFYLGDVYHRVKDYRNSDIHFVKALAIDSTDLLLLNNYAYYLSLREEKLDFAKRLSYKTIVKDSLNSTYLDTYGWVLFKLGEYEQAKMYIEKAIEYRREASYEIYDHYGDVLYKLGQIKKAVIFWEKAVSVGGENSDIILKIDKAKQQP